MKKHTQIMPMLPGFYLPRRGRKSRTPQQVFAARLASIKKKTFKQIGEIFSSFMPSGVLKQEQTGAMSRRRIFTKENTFWAFLGQSLDSDGGCKEVVRKLQSYASMRGLKMPSSSTASYCAARKNLNENTLYQIFHHTADWAAGRTGGSGSLNGRRVVVVDGTGVSMPDTATNQAAWPQLSSQKPGCGFPTARICAYFSLENGGMLNYAIGNKKCHELPLFRKNWLSFNKGDIFLGDKGFCSYFDIAELKDRGVDSVVTLARRKPVSKKKCLKELDHDDLLIEWKKPQYNKILSYSKEVWEDLPDRLVMRQIKVQVKQAGFRCKEFYIVTTLLDPEKYPCAEIAALYLKRWDVELFFRDIKTTMGFDILRCQSPEMIRKELLMCFIAYNCIRRLMFEAAGDESMAVRAISFKGSLQAIRSWESRMGGSQLDRRERLFMMADLYLALAQCKLRDRPGRSEPRCLKRRLKPYQLLTKPRHEMKEIEHRNRYLAKMA
ncbi:MAG: IS4 family transposase [Desulfopila sp.]